MNKTGLRVRFVAEDGAPVAGVHANFTEPSTLRHVSFTTGDDGIAVAPGPGPWAVAAATPDAYAFEPSMAPSTGSSTVALRADCHRVEGRILPTSLASRAVLEMGRASNNIGDRFLSTPQKDGTFRFCLPLGTYALRVSGRATAELRSIDINRAVNLGEVPAWSADEVATVPDDLQADLRSKGLRWDPHGIEALVKAVDSAAIVAVGESNHGTSEFFKQRMNIFEAIRERSPTRVVMIEASFGETLALDAAISGDGGTVPEALRGLKMWLWDTAEAVSAFERLRAINASLPRVKRVHVVGVDPVRTAGSVKALQTFSRAHRDRRLNESIAALSGFADDKYFYEVPKMSEDERIRLKGALIEAKRRTATLRASTADRFRVEGALAQIEQSIGLSMIELDSDLFELRDRYMAENALRAAKHFSGGVAVLWAHNGHVSRSPTWGMRTMGMHLATLLGEKYYAIGLLSGQGTFQAWDTTQSVGVIAQELPAPERHSVEGQLALLGADPVYLILRGATGPIARWLAVPRILREFGSVWPGDADSQILRRVLATFDAIAFIPKAKAAAPTPTGVRRAEGAN